MVLLAAGGSSRMGGSKQLLPYLGSTLVEHAARTALASGADEVVAVLGAEADEIAHRLGPLGVRLAINPGWESGMAGSIRCGIESLSPGAERAIIALADQPHVTPEHLRALASALDDSGKTMAASSYAGVVGAPCAFCRSEFARLKALAGDEGARKLIRATPDAVAYVELEGAGLDIDTPEAYRQIEPHDSPPAPASLPESEGPAGK